MPLNLLLFGLPREPLRAGLWFVVLCALATVLCRSIADPDLWGHLRFGLDALDAGAIAQADPYAYTSEGRRWINHEWLAEILFALAWTAGGTAGLVLLKALVGAATLALLCRPLVARGIPAARIAIVLGLLCTPLLVPFFAMVRPQIFTFLLYAAVLLIIRRAEDGAYRALWAAPPVLALWANLHGGVLAGLGLLGLWGLLHAARHWPARWKLFWPLLASPLALLLNPYGPELPFFLLHTATVPRPEIQDWQPLELVSRFGPAYLVVLATVVSAALICKHPNRTLLALCLFTALLPWSAVRHFPLFCITAMMFAGDLVAEAWARVVTARMPRPLFVDRPWLAPLPVIAGVSLLAATVSDGAFTRMPLVMPMPAGAVQVLRQSGARGNLAVNFDWGQYAIWHLGPGIKVSMDGRRETVYGPVVYAQYLDFHHGTRAWDALLKRHRADFALVRPGTPLHNLLKLSPGWSGVFADAHSVLLVNEASPAAGAVRRAAAGVAAVPAEAEARFP